MKTLPEYDDPIAGKAVGLLQKVQASRPKCHRCKVNPQTSWSYDAAGDPVATCSDCETEGGIDEDEKPNPVAGYEVFKEIEAFLAGIEAK